MRRLRSVSLIWWAVCVTAFTGAITRWAVRHMRNAPSSSTTSPTPARPPVIVPRSPVSKSRKTATTNAPRSAPWPTGTARYSTSPPGVPTRPRWRVVTDPQRRVNSASVSSRYGTDWRLWRNGRPST